MLNFSLFFVESTLEYHEELNPLLWANNKFNGDVKKKLLNLADFWAEKALIPKDAIKDILIVGGNANYNYTKYSDIDLHLLVDKSKIPDCDEEILDEFLMDKKKIWTLTHDVRIFGIPVEIYAQGLDEKYGINQGVYSLKNNKWLQEPKKQKIKTNDSVVMKKANDLIHKIKYIIDSRVDKPEIIDAFKEKMRKMRQSSLQKGGEFSIENLAYKEIRNRGYLDKLDKYLVNLEDKSFSLNKSKRGG